MPTLRHLALASVSAIVLTLAAAPASATLYKVDVYEKSGVGQFDAVLGSVAGFAGGSHATFNYNGNLNFSNTTAQNTTAAGDITSVFFGANAANISGYSVITAPVGEAYGSFATLGSFLDSSGSIAGYGYGSLYVFTYTGSTAGTNLTIEHDDGVSVYSTNAQNVDTRVLPTVAGPTSVITETVTLPASSGYKIVYGRENGSPSILNVSVPEPASLAILGAGLLGFGLVRRKRS